MLNVLASASSRSRVRSLTPPSRPAGRVCTSSRPADVGSSRHSSSETLKDSSICETGYSERSCRRSCTSKSQRATLAFALVGAFRTLIEEVSNVFISSRADFFTLISAQHCKKTGKVVSIGQRQGGTQSCSEHS